MEGVRGRRSVSPPDLVPASFTARDPIVLEYPDYTVEDVVSAWHQTEENAGKGKPYTRNKRDCFKDPMIFFTGKKKFLDATFGKRMINISISPLRSCVALCLPLKTGRAWYGIDKIKLPMEAPDEEYAAAVIQLAQKDLSEIPNLKRSKSMYNL